MPNTIQKMPKLIILLLFIFYPLTAFCDIASPTAYDAPAMMMNFMKALAGVENSRKILAVQDEFPRGIPIVIDADIVYQGSPEKYITQFDIKDVWPGLRNRPVQELKVKSYTGPVQIHGTGTGPAISRFPGMKITLTPQAQDTDLCGVIHFAVMARFRAWGKDFNFALPHKFITWDKNTFELLKVNDSGTAATGRLTSRMTNDDYTFYPVLEGSHQIGITVEGLRSTAMVNISPPEPGYLELIPDWAGAVTTGASGIKAMLHYRGECRPPKDVTALAEWSSRQGPEPRPVKLAVTSPSHPSGQVELCEDVSLKASTTQSPGKKIITALYRQMTASMMINDPGTPSNKDVTQLPGIVWSTGGPNFTATFPGRFTVTATDTASGLSASLPLNVVPPRSAPLYPLASLSIPGSVTQGDTIYCKAVPFSCNGTGTVSNLKWVSLSPDLLSCGSGGDCTALKPGNAQVAVFSNGGQLASRTITIKPVRTASRTDDAAARKPEVKSGTPDKQKEVSAERGKDWRAMDNRDFVKSLYESILDRAPDKSGFNHWVNLLARGKSRESCMSWFFKSPEYKSRKKSDADFITDVYQAAYGRNPTPEELEAALTKIRKGTSRQQLVDSRIKASAKTASKNKTSIGNSAPAGGNGVGSNGMLYVDGKPCWPRNYINPPPSEWKRYSKCDKLAKEIGYKP